MTYINLHNAFAEIIGVPHQDRLEVLLCRVGCEFHERGLLKTPVVGIVGIGGLGHVAVKIAKALGARPFAITTSPGKLNDSRRLGAEGRARA